MNREQTLRSACDAVLRDRQRTHGPIEDSFGLIAGLWSAYLSVPVTPFAVANLMTLLKIARAKGNPSHADNQVDGAGYQACAAELADAMAVQAPRHPWETVSGVFSDSVFSAGTPLNHTLHDLMRHYVDASTPNAAPPAPQTPPEGDHGQTQVKAQDGAIPDDCSDVWHNPREVSMSPEDHAEGWRLLLWDEHDVPADAEYWSVDGERWMPRRFKTRGRREKETYRTKAPLPGAPAPTAFAGALSTPPPVQPAPAEPQWHNPEGLTLTDGDKAAGWRFLTPGEDILPPDTEVTDTRRTWIASRFRGRDRYHKVTYRTRTPLPGTADASDNLHQTTP